MRIGLCYRIPLFAALDAGPAADASVPPSLQSELVRVAWSRKGLQIPRPRCTRHQAMLLLAHAPPGFVLPHRFLDAKTMRTVPMRQPEVPSSPAPAHPFPTAPVWWTHARGMLPAVGRSWLHRRGSSLARGEAVRSFLSFGVCILERHSATPCVGEQQLPSSPCRQPRRADLLLASIALNPSTR